MRSALSLGLIPGLAAALAAGAAAAEPTRVMVRAQALDAKFIGTSMGGVEVTLKDAGTGRVLARGVTAGGTGDTRRLIVQPIARGEPLTDDKTAGFQATLDIDRPTLVRAEARGPLGKPAAAVSVAATRWILPGKDLAGDGWILAFPGLVVEPAARVTAAGVEVTAKVALMCGCPIEPGGHWDAAAYQVRAVVAGGPSADLAYAGQTSTFAGALRGLRPGRHRLQVTAFEPRSGNAGVAEVEVTVPR